MIEVLPLGKMEPIREKSCEAKISKFRIKTVRVTMKIMFIWFGRLCCFSVLGGFWRVCIG